MYVKRHAVRRGSKRYVYLRLVQAYRDEDGRVRHRVLKTLGREDELKASGQLEQLMGSFARLDPPMAGVRREVGPLLLAWHFITALDLVGTVDRALPQRGRQQLSVGEALAALIASRLCSPSPLYDIAGWASGAALGELFGIPAALLNDDRLGPRPRTGCRCTCAQSRVTRPRCHWSPRAWSGCARSQGRAGC